jgi:hypothetical protein
VQRALIILDKMEEILRLLEEHFRIQQMVEVEVAPMTYQAYQVVQVVVLAVQT